MKNSIKFTAANDDFYAHGNVNIDIKVAKDATYHEKFNASPKCPHLYVLQVGNEVRTGKTTRPRKHLADLQRRGNFVADRIYVTAPVQNHKDVWTEVDEELRFTPFAPDREGPTTFDDVVTALRTVLSHTASQAHAVPSEDDEEGKAAWTTDSLTQWLLQGLARSHAAILAEAFDIPENYAQFFVDTLPVEQIEIAYAMAPYVNCLEYASKGRVYTIKRGGETRSFSYAEFYADYLAREPEPGMEVLGSFEELKPFLLSLEWFPAELYDVFGRRSLPPQSV